MNQFNQFNLTVQVGAMPGVSAEEVRSSLERFLQGYLRPTEVRLGPVSENADVRAFHNKFEVPQADQVSFLNPEAFGFRMKFMQEELDEFRDGHNAGDMHEAGDALIDLAYVVHGTALMMGLPWFPMWHTVQTANMAKERAKSAAESKRGSALDVIKPPGWKAPDHTAWLGNGPWPTFQEQA